MFPGAPSLIYTVLHCMNYTTWGLWSLLPGGHSDGGPNPWALAAGLPPQACTGQRAGHPQGPETLGPGDILLGLPFIPFYYRAEKITRFYFVRLSKLQHMVAYTLEFLHLYILKSMPGLLRSFKFSVTEKETGTIQTMCHLSSPSVTRRPSPTHTREGCRSTSHTVLLQGDALHGLVGVDGRGALPQVRFQIHVVSLYIKGIWAS